MLVVVAVAAGSGTAIPTAKPDRRDAVRKSIVVVGSVWRVNEYNTVLPFGNGDGTYTSPTLGEIMAAHTLSIPQNSDPSNCFKATNKVQTSPQVSKSPVSLALM